MTVVFVHGLPETRDIWKPLQDAIGRPSVAVALPGFGTPRAAGWSGTKDAHADWLARELLDMKGPLDVVAHDLGALLTMRIVTATDVPIRSWAVDVPELFHPASVWPERMQQYQKPGVGEEIIKASLGLPEGDPKSIVSRLRGAGCPLDVARIVRAAYDEEMGKSVLDFYRSAVPNVAGDWWKDVKGPTRSRGLVLLAPDPPEIEARSLEIAKRLGAVTASLGELYHCWMAEAPQVVAPVLERFWATLG